MARAQANKPYVSFVQGLITEASPLTFPENATISEDNFLLDRNGSRRRRFGIDYETGFALTDTGLTTGAYAQLGVSVHAWENIVDGASTALAVVQLGCDLYFYDLLSDEISASPLNGGSAVAIPGDCRRRIQTTVVANKLIVASGSRQIHVLSYDPMTDIVSLESHGITVRDTWGVESDLEVDERPVPLAVEHRYNLINQGWGATDPDANVPYYEQFHNVQGMYPSNADLAHLGRDVNDDEKFNPALLTRNFLGSTPAAKGHNIIDLFDRGVSRSTVAGSGTTLRTNFRVAPWGTGISGAQALIDTSGVTKLSGLPADRTETSINTVATYAGRAFYGGMESEVLDGDVRSPSLGSYILFTQIVDNTEKLGMCYQEADPTSADISDLIDTDGGIIKIPEMSQCIRMINIGRSLVVFAENGVWEISGGESNFTATSFEVTKISSVGVVGQNAVVNAEGSVFYWSTGGIYTLQLDDVSQRVTAVNITESTIQSFYDSIPTAGRVSAYASYDPASKKIQWLYNDRDSYDGVTDRAHFNRALTLDIVLGAFYPWTVGSTGVESPYIAAPLITPNRVNFDLEFNVVSSGNSVIAGADNVVQTASLPTSGDTRTKYLTVRPDTIDTYQITFSLENDATFVDWKTDNSVGVDAPAFMITGYELLGDIQRDKQVDYLTMHFLRSETGFELVDGELEAVNPSSCTTQVQWDFASSTASGKLGNAFEAYRLTRNYIPEDEFDPFDYGYKVITTKNKLRGSGTAISLRFDTKAAHDLQLLGWAINSSGNTNV